MQSGNFLRYSSWELHESEDRNDRVHHLKKVSPPSRRGGINKDIIKIKPARVNSKTLYVELPLRMSAKSFRGWEPDMEYNPFEIRKLEGDIIEFCM